MDDKQSFLDALMRQASTYLPPTFKSNCDAASTGAELQGYVVDSAAYATSSYAATTLKNVAEELQASSLRTDELSTIRKLLKECTIDATRHEVIRVLDTACSHPEECIDCFYKNSLGECNRNERIADILLNRFGRVK